MKILMPVLHYAPVIGGLETWTQNIAERLSDRAEIFVVAGRVKANNRDGFPVKSGLSIFRTSLFSLKNLSYSSLFYVFTALPFIFLKSLKIIKKEKIDILHCQGFLSAFLGCLLSRFTKVPFIVTVQRLEKKSRLRKIVYNNAVFCIAVSSAIKKYFQEAECQNIEVIPNGIDLVRFENLDRQKSRKALGLKDEFVVMTVARLEKVKGLKYLIEAAHILSSKLQALNVKFLIIGDGSERKYLEGLVCRLDLQNKVKFLGQASSERIPEYLAAADCFCLPSIREGFGIAILEAQAAGLPVIASAVGGILDIIENGLTGILVDTGSSKAIVQAIAKIYSSPEFARNLARNGKANLQKYDWQNVTERVYRIYQNI